MASSDSMLNLKRFRFNSLQTNCYVAWGEDRRAVLVDPGCEDEDEYAALTGFLTAQGLTPDRILLTHGHFDHAFAVAKLISRYGIKAWMHPADRETVRLGAVFTGAFGLKDFDNGFRTEDLADGDRIRIGETLEFRVIHTPGHTPGGVCFYDEGDKVLFSGDSLFAGSIGRTDLPGGEYDDLIRSLMDRIMGLPGDVTVLPGHGGETTLAYEAGHNPFLEPFNEPETDWDDLDPLSLRQS